jgi:hypothetical protein
MAIASGVPKLRLSNEADAGADDGAAALVESWVFSVSVVAQPTAKPRQMISNNGAVFLVIF